MMTSGLGNSIMARKISRNRRRVASGEFAVLKILFENRAGFQPRCAFVLLAGLYVAVREIHGNSANTRQTLRYVI